MSISATVLELFWKNQEGADSAPSGARVITLMYRHHTSHTYITLIHMINMVQVRRVCNFFRR